MFVESMIDCVTPTEKKPGKVKNVSLYELECINLKGEGREKSLKDFFEHLSIRCVTMDLQFVMLFSNKCIGTVLQN